MKKLKMMILKMMMKKMHKKRNPLKLQLKDEKVLN